MKTHIFRLHVLILRLCKDHSSVWPLQILSEQEGSWGNQFRVHEDRTSPDELFLLGGEMWNGLFVGLKCFSHGLGCKHKASVYKL